MTFMPCGIFMQRVSSLGMHLYTLPQTIVAYLRITFKVSEVRVNFFIVHRTAHDFKKRCSCIQLQTTHKREYYIYTK